MATMMMMKLTDWQFNPIYNTTQILFYIIALMNYSDMIYGFHFILDTANKSHILQILYIEWKSGVIIIINILFE